MSSCTGDFNLSISETKYTVEIETCVNSTGVNNVTIQNVSDTNLEINTNCVNPSHPTISAASSVDNSGSLFIQDILLDSYGHVTGINSAYATGTGIGGGSSNFLDLSDTPSTFSGQAGKYVVVNSGESALEFVSGSFSSSDTDAYLTGVAYDFSTHNLVLTTHSGSVTGVLSGVVHSGDNISLLVNDIAYITGYTETDPIFTGSVAYNISSSDTGNWNTAYGWGNHATGGYLISGDNISLLNNNVPYAISGSHIDITGASNIDNTGNIFVQDILMDQYGHVTGIRTASATGEGADNNYYVTGASFNSGNNHLVLIRTDGGTVTGILSGVVVSGSDYHISVNGTGVSESGRTYVQDILVDSYGHITGINTATETVVDTNTETLTVLSGSSINTGLYYTDESGTTNFISLSWAIDDTNLARLVSGSIDSSGIATFERDDATSFTVDFSALFDDTNLSRITSGNFDTSSGILTLTRELDDTSISVDFDGRYATTGELSSVSGYLQGQIDGVDTNTFVTGLSYDSSTHQLTLFRNSGTVSGELSNILHSGDNVSLLVNDAGYLTGLVGATGSFDYIDFTLLDDNSYPPHSEGRLFYDEEAHTLTLYNDEADISLQIGHEQYIRVRNNTPDTITNGSVVRINGAHNGLAPTIVLASADTEDNSDVAGVATHDIESSSFGYITTFGFVRDVVTSGVTQGAEIFLSTTSGEFTDTAPTIPNFSTSIGHVISAHPSNGTILVFLGKHKLGGGDVKSINGYATLSGIPYIGALGDTNAMGLRSTPNFVYNSGNGNVYISGNQVLVSGDNISQLVNDANYVDGSGIANYVAKWSDADTLTSGIIYDDGSGVGIGTGMPSYKLDVIGSGRFIHVDGACGLIIEDTGGSGIHLGDCAYINDATYAGIKHSNHGSQEFMIISNGNSTVVSSASGTSTLIRGGGNSTTYQATFHPTFCGIGDNAGRMLINSQSIQINRASGNYDFIVYGTGTSIPLIHADAQLNRIGIGTAIPSYKLDVSGTFSADSVNVNDAFTLPTTDGADGQVLATDGSGNVQWEHPRSSYIMSVMFG